jgi:hypothetical protein
MSMSGIRFPGPLCGILLLLRYYARGGPLQERISHHE